MLKCSTCNFVLRDLQNPAAWTVPEAPGEAYSFWRSERPAVCDPNEFCGK